MDPPVTTDHGKIRTGSDRLPFSIVHRNSRFPKEGNHKGTLLPSGLLPQEGDHKGTPLPLFFPSWAYLVGVC
ncbi:MAG: hypothetical protein HLUCCO16_13350 [Phormidium sp. OSCR]|nr:MAG: hypothetical protein HLUCCO16_13350 [Phormidium sp. OSCR]